MSPFWRHVMLLYRRSAREKDCRCDYGQLIIWRSTDEQFAVIIKRAITLRRVADEKLAVLITMLLLCLRRVAIHDQVTHWGSYTVGNLKKKKKERKKEVKAPRTFTPHSCCSLFCCYFFLFYFFIIVVFLFLFFVCCFFVCLFVCLLFFFFHRELRQ